MYLLTIYYLFFGCFNGSSLLLPLFLTLQFDHFLLLLCLFLFVFMHILQVLNWCFLWGSYMLIYNYIYLFKLAVIKVETHLNYPPFSLLSFKFVFLMSYFTCSFKLQLFISIIVAFTIFSAIFTLLIYGWSSVVTVTCLSKGTFLFYKFLLVFLLEGSLTYRGRFHIDNHSQFCLSSTFLFPSIPK